MDISDYSNNIYGEHISPYQMSVYPVYLYTVHFFSLSISLSTRSEAILPINVPDTEAAKLAQPQRHKNKITIPLRIRGPIVPILYNHL